MYQPTGIVAIVVLLNLFQLRVTDAAIKSLNQKYSYPTQQVNYNDYSLKDGIFVYAVCDMHNLLTEKSCTVIQRRFPYDEVAHSCNITLRVKHLENVNMTGKIWVHAFGKENAILLWAEMGSLPKLNLMAIRLDSCKTNVLELDDPDLSNYSQQILRHKILTYDNDYDIFFKDKNLVSESTGTQVGRRVGFDGEPQPIRDIMKNMNDNNVRFISPIATRSPDKGYIYSSIGKNADETVTLVKPDGTEKILMTREIYGIMTSANSDLITSCAKSTTDNQVKCTQFNENGDVKFNVTFDFEDGNASEIITVHTTPYGGFLLMRGKYNKLGEEVDYSIINNYDVFRVDSEGRKLGSVTLKDFVNPYSSRHYSIWENGDEYCVTLVSLFGQSILQNDIEVAVNCFSENDLSA